MRVVTRLAQTWTNIAALRSLSADLVVGAGGGGDALQSLKSLEGGLGGGAGAFGRVGGLELRPQDQRHILVVHQRQVRPGDDLAQDRRPVARPLGPELGAVVAVEANGHVQAVRRRDCPDRRRRPVRSPPPG